MIKTRIKSIGREVTIMSKQEKEIKALLGQYEDIKDSTSGEARAIRRKLRALGYKLSDHKVKATKKAKDEDDEEVKVKKSSKKAKAVKEEDEDEDEEDED